MPTFRDLGCLHKYASKACSFRLYIPCDNQTILVPMIDPSLPVVEFIDLVCREIVGGIVRPFIEIVSTGTKGLIIRTMMISH